MMRRFSGSSTPVAPIASVLASAATPAAGDSSYPNVPAVAGASTVGDMGINAYESARYGSSARRVGLALIASLVLLVATGCGATSTTNVAPTSTAARPETTSPVAWTGFGAKLSDWGTAHPKGSGGSGSGCSGEGCYGERIMINNEPTYQFTSFSTTGAPEYRVDGYEQALGEGMSLAVAKADVLKLMPSDTRVTAFWITHENGSCASWNLKSATLGRWFSGKKVGDPQGAIGVDLHALNSNDEPVFDSHDVSRAIVSLGPERRGTSC